ncbi:hypothetical protein KHQ82_07480 [Mycoplasmatota bacterium]|nr:hypothetical protein KHQ82_07480 [Mycoplasmatota bacterium]
MRKEMDFIGIIVGVVIGIVFGFFIHDKVNIVNSKEVSSEEKVYLLQIGQYDNSEDVLSTQRLLQENGIPNIVVFENDVFIIYSGISLDENFESITVLLDYSEISYVVKSKFLYNYISDYEESELTFWEDGLGYYMKSLNNEKFETSEEFKEQKRMNIEFYSNIVYLMSVQEEDLLNRIRLQTFKLLVENRV